MRLPVVVIAAMSLSACALEPTPAWQSGEPGIGHQVARDLCADCHAIERTGDSPNPGAPHFRRILETYRPEWLADDLHSSRAISLRRMPVFHFGEGHEYDIVAYLISIQEKPRPTPVP
jgi:cytochrome c